MKKGKKHGFADLIDPLGVLVLSSKFSKGKLIEIKFHIRKEFIRFIPQKLFDEEKILGPLKGTVE